MVKMGRKEIRITVLVLALMMTAFTVYSNVQEEEKMVEPPSSLEGCLKFKGVERQFCRADVAEINDDSEMCRSISESFPEIRIFCVSRIKNDREGCNLIEDDRLREVCLESIKMKNEWNQTVVGEVKDE